MSAAASDEEASVSTSPRDPEERRKTRNTAISLTPYSTKLRDSVTTAYPPSASGATSTPNTQSPTQLCARPSPSLHSLDSSTAERRAGDTHPPLTHHAPTSAHPTDELTARSGVNLVDQNKALERGEQAPSVEDVRYRYSGEVPGCELERSELQRGGGSLGESRLTDIPSVHHPHAILVNPVQVIHMSTSLLSDVLNILSLLQSVISICVSVSDYQYLR